MDCDPTVTICILALYYLCVSGLSCSSRVQLFATLRTVARLLCPWDSPDKNTEVGCHALLQGIFQNQGSNSPPYVFFIARRVLYH